MVKDKVYEVFCQKYDSLNKKEKEAFLDSMSYVNKVEVYTYNQQDLSVGNVVWIDYGCLNYKQEISYIHQGIIVAMKGSKAFIIPLSSTIKVYDEEVNLIIDKKKGVPKTSIAFIHDAKFLNIARIKKIIGKVDDSVVSELLSKFMNLLGFTID